MYKGTEVRQFFSRGISTLWGGSRVVTGCVGDHRPNSRLHMTHLPGRAVSQETAHMGQVWFKVWFFPCLYMTFYSVSMSSSVMRIMMPTLQGR